MTGKVLGTGYNGAVKKATRKNAPSPGESFAVKKFDLRKLSPKSVASLEAEVQIYLCMDHPHIARLVNVYETPQTLSLVMECCEGGELYDRLKAVKRFPEAEAAQFVQQMLLAVHYLHTHGIAHRDLKLENFLLDQQDGNMLKLIDFGFSRFCEEDDSLQRMKTSCGTLSYVAPEVLGDTYTDQCDLWSVGVITFIMLSGVMPFGGSSNSQKLKILRGQFQMKDERWGNLSKDARDFTKALLQVDPNVRLSAGAALEHLWIQNNVKRTPVKLDNSSSVLNAFQTYKSAPKFRRCCLLAMTWLLTSRETAQMQEEFLAIDKDQQGTITLSELQAALPLNCNMTELDVIDMFKAIDANHDDEIHYSEFMAAMLSSRIHLNDKLLNTTFRNFDKDLSGYITADNLRDSLGKSFEGKRVETLIAEADILKDGRVSFDEFVSFTRGVPLGSQSVCLSYTPKPLVETIEEASKQRMTGKNPNAPVQQPCCNIM